MSVEAILFGLIGVTFGFLPWLIGICTVVAFGLAWADTLGEDE